MHRVNFVDISLDAVFLCLCLCLTMFSGPVGISEAAPPVAVGSNVPKADEVAMDDAPGPEGQAIPVRQDDSVIVLRPDAPPDTPTPEQLRSAANSEEKSDQDYLIQTATPGDTMTRQGPDLAIGRLHPQFVHRLAGAIREAREGGLASAGIFSAYRPPAFGVGGFSDKFNSLHTYGLAVDMTGIGGPGSDQARRWHEIAAKHGVECPYGFANRVEWNHCQPTHIKIIRPESPLRETVRADGPIDLQTMFQAGASYIEKRTGADDTESEVFEFAGPPDGDKTNDPFKKHMAAIRKVHWTAELIKLDHLMKAESQILSSYEPPAWCSHLNHPQKRVCGASREISRKPRQALAAAGRESHKL